MKKIVFLILLGLYSLSAFSQKEVDESSGWSLKERAYFGLGFGGLGLGTSNAYGKYFSIGVTPMAGYMLTKNLSSGLAFEYQYTSYSDLNLRLSQYAVYPFVRYNIKSFFIQGDYDWYSIPDISTQEQKRKIFNRAFVGVGYSSNSGGRGSINFLVSYDLLYTNTSPFSSPLSVRIFATF